MSPSKRQPDPDPPGFLVDRSLGRHILPDALRSLGLVVHTLADIFGEEAAQGVKDEEWIELAGRERWVVLTKDDRIRYRTVERTALIKSRLRVFCLTTGNLTGQQQADRFVANMNRIFQRAARPGPYIYAVYENELRRIWPS